MLDYEISSKGPNGKAGDMMQPNWLVGNSVETEQWESGNANRSFPFADDSLPDGFPRDTIVDAFVVVPSSVAPSDAKVSVGSMHIGPSMASVFILVGGEPALYCNVLKDRYEPFTPVAMESVMPGVSGMVTFGNVDFGMKRTYRLGLPLSESAVARPVVGRLEKFVKVETGEEASGIVGFDFPDGISISMHEDGDNSQVVFEAGPSIRGHVPSPCYDVDAGPKTMSPPIKNINGVVPDELGRIAVVFLHDESELKEVE